MPYRHTVRGITHDFADLRTLLARASPHRSGDELAGVAAASAEQRVAAQMALADLPLRTFLAEAIVPYESDDVTRLIIDNHDAAAFAPVASLTVGELRDWLLSDDATPARLAALAPGLTPEMAAAVSKLMRVQDLIYVASKISVITRFRTTVGMRGRLATRLQPNHPTDDTLGIAAAMLDGLKLGSGDAVIGINPVSDSAATVTTLLRLIDRIRRRYAIPTQSCVLAHLTTQMQAIEQGAPLDLLFQSIAGTEAANRSFGITLGLLSEAQAMAEPLQREGRLTSGGSVDGNAPAQLFYFETGQGSALSANAHLGSGGGACDQQTLEARAYAVARHFHPFLVNTVVGFIGPEYLYDGKQILRAGLEDHFCGKLLGLPMGCDICYTNHAQADQDDMDALLTMLGAAGVNYIMGVPGADDIMLNYQSTSFQDALYLRRLLGLRPAPEFEQWLASEPYGELQRIGQPQSLLLDTSSNGNRRTREQETHYPRVRSMGSAPVSGTELAHQQPWSDERSAAEHSPSELHSLTPARLSLGRPGPVVPTREQLSFQLDHALARDAVHMQLDVAGLLRDLSRRDQEQRDLLQGRFQTPIWARPLVLRSEAAAHEQDRSAYLRRPDLGRRLHRESASILRAYAEQHTTHTETRTRVVVILADGLSAQAVERHALPLLDALLPQLAPGLTLGPLCIVTQARVAIGDHIGALLGASLTVLLIGERPGLSAPDSLGAYLTWNPQPGRSDAERNCISNIRTAGLSYAAAAQRIAFYIREACRLQTSGIALKDPEPEHLRLS